MAKDVEIEEEVDEGGGGGGDEALVDVDTEEEEVGMFLDKVLLRGRAATSGLVVTKDGGAMRSEAEQSGLEIGTEEVEGGVGLIVRS